MLGDVMSGWFSDFRMVIMGTVGLEKFHAHNMIQPRSGLDDIVLVSNIAKPYELFEVRTICITFMHKVWMPSYGYLNRRE